MADWREWICEGLANETIQPAHSHEHGVYILNIDDALGMDFEILFLAVLNEGLLRHLKEHPLFTLRGYAYIAGGIRKRGAADISSSLAGQSYAFRAATGFIYGHIRHGSKGINLSTRAINEDGSVQVAGRYYRALWELGKGAVEHALHPDEYDQWRLNQLGEDNFLKQHFERQVREKESARKHLRVHLF